MKHRLTFLLIAAALLAASATLYGVHYLLFQDAHHIGLYLVTDLAFLPVEVLLVGLIVERLLARHERRQRLRKMNMVIGTFFSELGTRLLGDLAPGIEDRDEVLPHLAVGGVWKPRDYARALDNLRAVNFCTSTDRLDLAVLKQTLLAKRDFLVLLLANPNLMEHERFTDLLWAVFHLMEELAARPSLDDLPAPDRNHLAGDVRRVYTQLAGEWLRYCRHLQESYPYIFSVVIRTHPLQDHPSAIVRE